MIFGEYSILTELEVNLGKTKAYLCGSIISLVDIVIYCELVTVMKLSQQTGEDLKQRGLHETHRWYSKLGEYQCFQEGNEELQKVITDNSLSEKIHH
jgi:glutathione S-transferase